MSEENKKNKDYEFILLERLESKVDLLIEGQTAVRKDVDFLKEDMDQVKSDIFDIKIGLKGIQEESSSKAKKEVVDDHETRIIKLENTALAKA
ncbi:MAG TPA: hypothetical protein PLK35_03165 [Candidatus Moranbacteria bacterium]|nr:hypothetical protein [Candidatus Moranbacteria bacterium]